MASAQCLLVLTNGDKVVGATFSPDGQLIATVGLAEGLKLWDAQSGSLLPKPFDLEQDATALAFSPDGRRLACAAGPWVFDADAEATLNIFHLNGGPHQSFRTHRKGILRVCFSPDGRYLATASLDGTARVWDVETGTEIVASRVVLGPDAVREVAFSPDGHWLAVCGAGWVGGAKVFEVQTGRLVRSLEGHSIGVTAIGFSPDGSKLATASYDGTARIWSAAALPEFLSLEGHDQPVWVMAFSPDGKRLASGSFDRTARVWDAQTGDSLAILNVGFPVVSLAFGPEGDRLVTTGPDHTACISALHANHDSRSSRRKEAQTEIRNPKWREPPHVGCYKR